MKTFEEVQDGISDWEKECLLPTSEFLDYVESGCITPYDGVGYIHDGTDFMIDGFEESIFTFIKDKVKIMGIEGFIEKYPYVAWYNK